MTLGRPAAPQGISFTSTTDRSRSTLSDHASFSSHRPWTLTALSVALLFGASLFGCDSDFKGSALENLPPNTALSVRDESLVDNLADDNRLLSTLRLSWSGDDPDGFVIGFDVRVFPATSSPDSEDLWVFTTRNDSLLLLPLPSGESIADVVVEVRAVDNEGAKDPTPARSVFPIQNSPPTIRFSQFELPPDTTFPVVSFAYVPDDPDGIQNLQSVGVSLNDSTSFVEIPPEFDFVTLVGDQNQVATADEVDARLFLGRGVEATSLVVPGMRLDADNTFYIRTTDQADTTSTIERFTWRVKRNASDILYVNDYRLSTNQDVKNYHLDILAQFLPPGMPVDTWDISEPFTTGSSGTVPRSSALPPVAEPMLRLTLSLYRFIYWVSTSTTGNVGTDNMPFVAPAMAEFFGNGGKMLVHSPVNVPTVDTDFTDNAAVLLLPLSEPLVLPDSVRRLELASGAPVTPTATGTSLGLPALESSRFFINLRPYRSTGANIESLYTGAFRFRSASGGSGDWTDPNTVASISADRRIALMALPLVNDLNSTENFTAPGDTDPAGLLVVHALLRALEFPSR